MHTQMIDTSYEFDCYQELVSLLHPDGLCCPRCIEQVRLAVHRRHREPVLDYRCLECGRVFNAWTGTAFSKTHHRPSELLLIIAGILEKRPTADLARQLGCQASQLQRLRVRLQRWVWSCFQEKSPPLLAATASRLTAPPH
jgi:transposase-like protein